MHDIEPYYHWRDRYVASEDDQSPFYGREYDEFAYSNKIYNYFIHPQWDAFGSPTLYAKVIYVDYDERFAIIEFIGEWNDCLTNDVMHLKRNVIDRMLEQDINKYCLIFENVLNFHGSDDCYYEEWREDVVDSQGWIAVVNPLDHVEEEMRVTMIDHFIQIGGAFTGIDWRVLKPQTLVNRIDEICRSSMRFLSSP